MINANATRSHSAPFHIVSMIMMLLHPPILSLLLFPAAILSVPWDGAHQTPSLPEYPKPIVPTTAPALKTPSHSLLKRQHYTGQCGYVDADILQELTCRSGHFCAQQTSASARGCCRLGQGDNCVLPTSCIPQLAVSKSCDSECSSNESIIKCTNQYKPYCYTYSYVSGPVTPREVGCTSKPGINAFVYTTYTGFGSVNFEVSTPTPAQSAAPGSGTHGSASASDFQSSESGNDSTEAAGSDGSNNSGAIAGGVVGGVAVLGASVALVVWICLRHRRKAKNRGLGPGDQQGAQAVSQNDAVPQKGQQQSPAVSQKDTGPQKDLQQQQLQSPPVSQNEEKRAQEIDATPSANFNAQSPIFEAPNNAPPIPELYDGRGN